MKSLALWAMIASILALVLLHGLALAQGPVPPPYAGLKNPFPWNDPSAQTTGKGAYQQYCLGCHGVTGNGVASADFSAKTYPQQLETAPDLYFWIVSEGRMDSGMPSYKASLSEQQRWQILTYIWSLGSAPPAPTPTVAPEGGSLKLNSPSQVPVGQPLGLSALLLDKANKPISGFAVSFFTRENFFASALMAIGDATTDGEGVASLQFVPRRAGPTELVAAYGSLQASGTVTVTGTEMQFYQAKAGIRLPAAGPPVFIGPPSATEPSVGQAPTSAFRLPGGLISWLWLFVLALALIWGTYVVVMREVLRIPAVGRVLFPNSTLVPRIGLAIIVLLAVVMVVKIVTGPYSHFHLIPY